MFSFHNKTSSTKQDINSQVPSQLNQMIADEKWAEPTSEIKKQILEMNANELN